MKDYKSPIIEDVQSSEFKPDSSGSAIPLVLTVAIAIYVTVIETEPCDCCNYGSSQYAYA